MKSRTINKSDSDSLILRDETHFYDQKSIEISGAKVQKIAVAFANSDGGEFIIGIKDSKEEKDFEKRWAGAEKIEDFNSHLQALSEICPTIDFSCTFFSSQAYKGIALLIKIEKSGVVHKTASNDIYVRNGAQSIKLTNADKVLELQLAKGASSFEDFVVSASPAEIVYENDNIKKFLSQISPKTEPLDYCISENLLDLKTYDPKVSGILLFSDNPSANMPRKCAVKIVRYETKEDEPERENLKETFTLEGPTYQLIHKTVEKVSEIMSEISVWTTRGLRKMEYPSEAIWEILTNAIIHRDYSISDDVQIHIFDNRIEVISPGKLPGYVTVDNILDARFARNTKIVRTLSKYKNAPNKDIGEGLNTAFEKMKEWKLQSPTIKERGNYVVVTIPHIPLARPAEMILNFLSHNDTINNRQARDITGIKSENSMKTEFYKLREEGYLERVPGLEGPASAWRLTEKANKEIK